MTIEKHVATTQEVAIHAGARLRARVLSLISAALEKSGMNQVALAKLLGVRKGAVNQVFKGNGNVRIETLSQYLAALGYEVDLSLVQYGEIDRARQERRAPRTVTATIRDHDRLNAPHVVAITEVKVDRPRPMNEARSILVSPRAVES